MPIKVMLPHPENSPGHKFVVAMATVALNKLVTLILLMTWLQDHFLMKQQPFHHFRTVFTTCLSKDVSFKVLD